MSTSTPSTSSARPPRPSQTDNGSAFGSTGVTNYFFGFLFLFAVILLILIGCGVGTRRRLLSRRANPLASLEPWTLPDSRGEITPPDIHESKFVVTSAASWKHVMPLSAAYLDDKQALNEKSVDDVELGYSLPDTTTNQPPTSPSNFPTFTFLRKTPSNPKVAARPANAIRVAILVAMPFPREEHQGPGTDDQHVTAAAAFGSETNLLKKAPEDIQIGVETLPWRGS